MLTGSFSVKFVTKLRLRYTTRAAFENEHDNRRQYLKEFMAIFDSHTILLPVITVPLANDEKLVIVASFGRDNRASIHNSLFMCHKYTNQTF